MKKGDSLLNYSNRTSLVTAMLTVSMFPVTLIGELSKLSPFFITLDNWVCCCHNLPMDHEHFHIDDLVMERMHQGSDYACEIYNAVRTEVVLGRGSRVDEDVIINACAADNVPISRRRGGGGTVLLSHGTIILSVAGRSVLQYHLREHMNAVNLVIIDTLRNMGVRSLSIRGTSDIALGTKKILGSSLYRRKDTLLYQGSLLVNPDLSLINRYLKHPRKQPAYRMNRTHRNFVTSLHREGYTLPIEDLVRSLQEAFGTLSPWPPLAPNTPGRTPSI